MEIIPSHKPGDSAPRLALARLGEDVAQNQSTPAASGDIRTLGVGVSRAFVPTRPAGTQDRASLPSTQVGGKLLAWSGSGFLGGMDVPTRLGRARAGLPLAALTIDDELVTLGPSAPGRLLLMRRRVSVVPADIAVAYPLEGGRLGPLGVGLDLADGRTVYFKTLTDEDAVLAALHARGVRIDPAPRRPSATFPWKTMERFRRRHPN